MEKENPISAFNEWYSSLPPDHQEEIALLSGAYMPGVQITLTPNSGAQEAFVAYIAAHKDNTLKAIGMAIALHHIIDHAVTALHTTSIDTEFQQENLREVKRRLDELHGERYSESMGKLIQTRPFKAAGWKRTSESWSIFKNDHFNEPRYKEFLSRG
jgi:hypothetical protein